MTAPGRKRKTYKTYDVVIDMTPTTFTSAKSTVAMCAGEAGVVVAHGQACWEAPSSSGMVRCLERHIAATKTRDSDYTAGVRQVSSPCSVPMKYCEAGCCDIRKAIVRL